MSLRWHALQLRPVQPLTADTKVVRYFIALKDNTVVGPSDGLVHYVNRYLSSPLNKSVVALNTSGLTTDPTRTVDRNMYVLYRAEFSPTDPTLFPSGRTALQNINDPNFFYNTNLNNADSNYPNERYCDAWNKISRVVAAPDDLDLVTTTYDSGGNPVVTPTVHSHLPL